MLLAILLVCITSVASMNVEPLCNTCVKADYFCHNMTFLFNLQAPFRNTVVIPKMGILRSKNILYYAFEPSITDAEYYKVAYVNLDQPESNGVVTSNKLINNFGTFDIDQGNKVIYLGGSDGIAVIDVNNTASFYSSRGDTITNILFYKGNVFFTTYDEKKIIRKKVDIFKIYDDYTNVKNFVINKDDIVVFLNTTGLYAVNRNHEVVYLSINAFFTGLAVDLDDIVYAWWIDGIYKLVVEKEFADSRIVKFADISGIGALTFDNDNNVLFSSGKGLFTLIKTNTTNC